MDLKAEIAARCGSCKAGTPIKVLGSDKLIHLSVNYKVKLGRCGATDLLLPHLITTDDADNPVWGGEALNAFQQLEAHERSHYRSRSQ